MRIGFALLTCAACSGPQSPKSSTIAVADAIVGKHPSFVFGVRGGDPELVAWSGRGRPILTGGAAFVLDPGTADGRGSIQAVAGTRAVGRVAQGERAGAHLGIDAVLLGDELVVHGSAEYGSAITGAAPHAEDYLDVFRMRALEKMQRIVWVALPAQLLPSTDVDGDGRRDLITYGCAVECTVSAWRATATGLETEKPIATWNKHQRAVAAASLASGYLVAVVEPFEIRTYAIEHGSLRALARIEHPEHDDRAALDGPIAIGNDEVAAVSRGNRIYVSRNGRPPTPLGESYPERIRQIALVDLDRDGNDDLLVATDNDAALYRGSPSGFEPSPSWRAHLP